MNSREVVRRLHAYHDGRPRPRGATKHLAIADDKDLLVVAFVRVGGESRPWGIAYGRPDQKPKIMSVPEGRNRDMVSDMVAEFAPVLLKHVQAPGYVGREPESADDLQVLKQIWLPNPTHLDMLQHLAYAYAYTKSGGGIRGRLNAFGRACNWLFRESQRPGEQLVIVATEALRRSFTFPADDVRQGHLGYLMGWLTASGNRATRMAAAMQAERESIATTLDPHEERSQFEDRVSNWRDAQRADDTKTMDRLAKEIASALRPELERRFQLTVDAISLLRADRRPMNPGVETLVEASLQEQWDQYLRLEVKATSEEGPTFFPSVETDRHPAAAASRFLVHEASADLYESVLLQHDAELQAEALADGNAIRGVILEAVDANPGRGVQPVWTVKNEFSSPLRLRHGSEVCVVGLPNRHGVIRSISEDDDGDMIIEVELKNLRTAVKGARGILAVPPSDSAWVGQIVTFAKRPMHQLSRTKSRKVWKADVQGGWLTHRRPGGPLAEVSTDDDVDDVAAAEAAS